VGENWRVIGMLAGVTALGFVIIIALFLALLGRSEELRVRNESGGQVSVVLGLSSLSLAPGESGTLENEFDESTDDLQIFSSTYNVCDWDEARDDQPLIVTDQGAQCRDTQEVPFEPIDPALVQ
jgi:hypothetical protein